MRWRIHVLMKSAVGSMPALRWRRIHVSYEEEDTCVDEVSRRKHAGFATDS
jgi:hypothetical protein